MRNYLSGSISKRISKLCTNLIVDNDMLSRKRLAMIAGYEQFEIVDKVTTGEKAVKVCRSCAVDLVFVEMQLPGISGAKQVGSSASLP